MSYLHVMKWSIIIAALLGVTCILDPGAVSSLAQESERDEVRYDTILESYLKTRIVNRDTQFVRNYINYLKSIEINDTSQYFYEDEILAKLAVASGVYPSVFAYRGWQEADSSHIHWFHKEQVLGVLYNYYCSSCLFGNTNILVYAQKVPRGDFSEVKVFMESPHRGASKRKLKGLGVVPLNKICEIDSIKSKIKYAE